MVAAQGLDLRAQVFGLLCLALLLVLVAGRRDRPTLLWLAVPILAAWAKPARELRGGSGPARHDGRR